MASAVLDADQSKAAAHRVGTAAVAAAAGSGKTTLLVGRAIALVEAGEAAESILTLAFNRNAAATLRERLSEHSATRGAAATMASTFHAFAYQCVQLVTPGLRVLGASAAEAAAAEERGGAQEPRRTARDLARDVFNEMGGNIYGAERPPLVQGVTLDDIFSVEPGARERLFSPEGLSWPTLAMQPSELRARLYALRLRDVSPETLNALVEFMPRYRLAKQREHVVDFVDMLVGLGSYIRQGNDRVMARLRKIRHLQVDEAQDGNALRWYIARTVAGFGEGRSVMAVGDLRQSIAGFAGAQPELFKSWWDNAAGQFTLPRNYRSARLIVEAGNIVARGEPWNIGGDAVAARADLGEGRVRVEPVGPLSIGVEIASAIGSGDLTHKDVTVLARTRAALEMTAFALRARGLKAHVRGGGNPWNGTEGKRVLAYLRFADGQVDDLRSAVMALNSPLRYVSRARLEQWVTNGQLNQRLYREADNYRPAAAVVEAFDTLSSLGWVERVEQVESWLLEGMEADRAGNRAAPGADSDRADLLRSLCLIARTCGSFANLLIAIEAETRVNPKDADVVELSTIHQSKGDQWKTVYVTGLNEGVFPHIRATSDEEYAEEVRLLYVAVTRPVSTLVVDLGVDIDRFKVKLSKLTALAEGSGGGPDGGGSDPASDEDDEDGDDMPPAPPVRPEPAQAVIEAPKPPRQALVPGGLMEATSPDGMSRQLSTGGMSRAASLTEGGVQPAPGSRFVPVRLQEMQELLGLYGFAEDSALAGRARQRVLAASLNDGSRLLVYTSIPPNADVARELGEDSIKVTLLDSAGRPMAKRQPYAARTRNWRSTLITRLLEALNAHPTLKVT